jgi:protein-S-isoprenylcysteine O-methyltransferase Ste14
MEAERREIRMLVKSLFTALRATIYASGFVAFWFWLTLGVRALEGSSRLPGWTTVPGVVLMFAGVAVVLASIASFVVFGQGTPAPFDEPRQFVARGPYLWVRNPMYVGGLALLAGWALFERSPAILVFAVCWFGAAHLFVVAYEEPHLRRRFGPVYDGYCDRVPRWIPGSRRSHGA